MLCSPNWLENIGHWNCHTLTVIRSAQWHCSPVLPATSFNYGRSCTHGTAAQGFTIRPPPTRQNTHVCIASYADNRVAAPCRSALHVISCIPLAM